MKLSKKEVINFGKIQSLSKMALIAINEQLCIEYINTYTKKLLGLPDDHNLIGKSIIAVFEQLNLPSIINDKGKIINPDLILINGYFQKWEKITTQVENEKWWLLIGHTIAWKEKLFQIFSKIFEKDNKNTLDKDKVYLNRIIENLPELVYWKDSKGVYQGCNQHVAELLNLNTPAEIIGRTDYDFGWSKERIKWLREVDASIIQKGICSIAEDAIPINNSTKIYLTSKTPLYNKEGEIIGVLGISTDITERKKMEEDLKIAKETAEAASHAKSEFIANMSHDIRTPLAGVIGISEILESTLNDPEQKEEAHMLYNSGEELLSMLNDILNDVSVGNMDSTDIHLDTFDLYQCMEDLVKLERPTTTLKHLGLYVDIDKDVPRYIISDRNKIHRILLNLLGNAIKFTPAGHITIQVTCLKSHDNDTQLQFSVTDTGIGIPKGIQGKVFDRFFRATPSYKGIYKGYGLGLHIVRSYVELLGGKIRLTSEEGVGTTVYFDLPCRKGAGEKIKNQPPLELLNASSTPASLPSSSLSLPNENENTAHLLLVEDNQLALKVLETMVSKNGYRFKSVSTGEDALELAKTIPFDLIITDIGLPGISGNEFVVEVRAWEKEHAQKPIPIIGLTGHTNRVVQAECLKAGMNEVFSKPITLHLIQNIANQYLLRPSEEAKNTKAISTKNLGAEFSKTEKELIKLENFPIFDPQIALKHLGGNLTLLNELIKGFISEEKQEDIYQMEKAYATKNWSEIEKFAHKLKGGAIYLGISRLELACQYLERYYKADNKAFLEQLYHQLLAVNQETIHTLRQWLAEDKP